MAGFLVGRATNWIVTNRRTDADCDLVAIARGQRSDPVIGRDQEIDRLIAILSREDRPNSVVLVGPDGVGRSAVVEGLLHRIVADGAESLAGRRIIAPKSPIAVGDVARWELAARSFPIDNGGTPGGVLYCDDLPGLGSVRGQPDIARQVLEVGTNRGVGGQMSRWLLVATPIECRKLILFDAVLRKRFDAISVGPLASGAVLQLLRRYRDRCGQRHNIWFTDEGLGLVAELSGRHLPDDYLPGSGLNVMQRAGELVETQRRRNRPGEDFFPEAVDLERQINEQSSLKDDAVRRADYDKAAVYRDAAESLRARKARLWAAWYERSPDAITVPDSAISDAVAALVSPL